MSIWGEIRKKSLGLETRMEDATPEVTSLTANIGGHKKTITVNHNGTGRSIGQIKTNILKLVRKHNWYVNKINQLDNEIFNDRMSDGLMDGWMVPEQKTEISMNDTAGSLESFGDFGLRDLEKSIYRKCLDLEKEYNRKKDDYDHHRFPKEEEFDLPF